MRYIVTFSTGETFIRNSNHEYKTAAAYVNVQTGKIKNLTFSKDIASPSTMGVCSIPRDSDRRWFSSKQAFEKARDEAIENAKLWKVEVVNVQTVVNQHEGI